MQLRPPGRTRIAHHHTVQPKLTRVPHSTTHTHVRSDATHHQVPDPAHIQQQLEIRVAERTLPGLIDHGLPFLGRKLRDDGVPRLAPHQQPAQRARVADAHARGAGAAAGEVAGEQRAEVGPVAFARVEDGVARAAEGREEGLDAGDDGAGGGEGEVVVVGVASWGADWEVVRLLGDFLGA